MNAATCRTATLDDSQVLHPIGRVESTITEQESREQQHFKTSRIILEQAFRDGLDGLFPGEEILVVFWFHHTSGYDLRQYPKGDATGTKRGVFTLRSPRRPNPIGITQVRVTALEGNVLYVTGLDALNGTPVLDLKPVSRSG